ncbi:EamA family transporter [Leucobacter tardus]|uniref:EamA family transporter n=2 Tax=Leucobacter tardus TaxID=501483 RepID=A0A939QCJ4_9MICO|nr:EamA family transporter [Leucobacter tardus]
MAVAAMMLIQVSNALSVSVIAAIGPAGTAWLRMCFGTLFLWAIARPALRSIRARDIPNLVALGAATGGMTTLFLAAIDRIPLGTAVAIEFLGPLTVAAIASTHRRALIWPVLALAGVVLLTEPWHGDIDLVGVGFALAAAVCWAFYNVFTQRVGDRFSGISGLSLTIPIGALLTMPFGLPQVVTGDFSWGVLGLVAGIALITPVVSFGLEMLALRRMTHSAFGTLLSIEPAFGVIMGLLLLSQSPTILQVIGIAVVIVAGIAAQRGGIRDRLPGVASDTVTAHVPAPNAEREPGRGPDSR